MGVGDYNSVFGDDSYDYSRDNSEGSGGSSGQMSKERKLYSFRFQVPKPSGTDKVPNLVCPGQPATKRVIFISNDNYQQYEHGLWKTKDARRILGSFTTPCVPRNAVNWKGGDCPLCSKEGLANYCSSITFFPIIDMGQVERLDGRKVKLHHEFWSDKKGDQHFRRFQQCLVGFNRGTEKNPGMLFKFRNKVDDAIAEERLEDRRLEGTVWHARRNGDNDSSCGSDWIFIEKIKREQIKEYLMSFGAQEEELDLIPPMWLQPKEELKSTHPGVFDYDAQDLYRKHAILAGWTSSTTVKGSPKVSGSEWVDGPMDDDIPF